MQKHFLDWKNNFFRLFREVLDLLFGLFSRQAGAVDPVDSNRSTYAIKGI